MKNILITILVFGIIFFAYAHFTNIEPAQEPAPTEPEEIENENEIPQHELIKVDTPSFGAKVGNPIELSGEARGYWFFEATAPVVVTNWDGLIIGQGYVTAEGEWMTEDFVPFSGTLSYDLPEDSYSASGTLIFHKSNASGLPEHDDAFEIPILLSN